MVFYLNYLHAVLDNPVTNKQIIVRKPNKHFILNH